MRKEEMPTIFADQIKMQNKGSIIGPFRSGVGFHILKIEDVKGLETVAVTEVNARHILIKPTVILSDEGAKKQLNEFVRRIKAGEATLLNWPHNTAKTQALRLKTVNLVTKHQIFMFLNLNTKLKHYQLAQSVNHSKRFMAGTLLKC